MKEVLNFLKETGSFYIATVDGDQPKVRPFAFFMEFEEKLYFATSETRNVYQQLQTNPKFQVSVIGKNMKWVRITGKANFDRRPEVFEAAVAAAPQIFGNHKKNPNPNFKPVFFFVDDGDATFYNNTEQTRSIKL
jgi:uncharacterized pyridoxamine 5'-phosphate oxidase family protein